MNTFLDERNIDLLKSMFSNRETYEQHLKTFGVLRALLWKNIEGEADVKQHAQYPVFELCNELIGALLQDGYYFTGGVLEHTDGAEYQKEVLSLAERNGILNAELLTGEVSRTVQDSDWMNNGSKQSIEQGDTLESVEATGSDLLEMTRKPVLCLAKMKADGQSFCGLVSAKVNSGGSLRIDFLKPYQQPIHTSLYDVKELRKVVNVIHCC